MCLIIVWQSIEMLLPPGPWCFLHRTCISSRDAVVIGSPLIMLPAIWIRTFSRLTSISISGILSSLILIAVVVTAFALDPTREAVHDPSSSVHKAVNWAHLPIATGILIVSLSGNFSSWTLTMCIYGHHVIIHGFVSPQRFFYAPSLHQPPYLCNAFLHNLSNGDNPLSSA
jgi:hypothetical protein